MTKNKKQETKAECVVEMCFPAFKGRSNTGEWFAAYGPGPRAEVLSEFYGRFQYEVGQTIGFGVQNGDRVYRIRDLETGMNVLLLGPTATVSIETVGKPNADGSQKAQWVVNNAEDILCAASTELHKDALARFGKKVA